MAVAMTSSRNTCPVTNIALPRGDTLIVLLFALFGLSAGILSYVSTLSYESQLDGIASAMDFPAILTLFWIEWFVLNPDGLSILNGDIGKVTILVGSVIVWSLIGLIIVGIARLFKLGP